VHPRKASGEDSAGEERAELADHEARQAVASLVGFDPGEERLEVLGENLVENRLLGPPPLVGRRGRARSCECASHGLRVVARRETSRLSSN